MSRGLSPRECDALNMIEAGEPLGLVAQLCRLTVADCHALARQRAPRPSEYADVCASLTGREMFDDEVGAWWVQ